VAVAAALALYQVFSSVQTSQLMKRQGEFDKRVAAFNAEYLEKDAWEAELLGYSQTARYKVQEDKILGDQVAIFEAQNVDSTSGTAKELQEETKLNSYLNTLDIQKIARADALKLKLEASNVRLLGSFRGLQANSNAATVQSEGLVRGITTGVSGYLRSES